MGPARHVAAIEIRSADGSKKFAAMLSIKGYSPTTYQGILNELSVMDCEYTLTQSFRFYDQQVTKGKLRDQQKDMMQSHDESISQTDQIEDVFDDAASGEVGYGKHHFSLMCFSDSLTELDKQVGLIVSKFSNHDIACVREDVASECTFGHKYQAIFHIFVVRPIYQQKIWQHLLVCIIIRLVSEEGNHWGEAVTCSETLSGSPYYFNFHYKDVGNFLVFGAMGSGKTVLLGFLILQSMKFGGKRIIFDKDRGQELLVRAMNGV